MTVNGIAAAQWLLDYGSVTPGRCLYYVWLAYKAQGASTDRGAPNAYIAWGDSDGQRPGDRNPPAGAAVWWGRRSWDGNLEGDVVISLGGGRVAVTEAPGQGPVTGSCTLDEREAQISREYLGWTSSIFDCPINVAAGKDASLTNAISTASEEDNMIIVQIDPRVSGAFYLIDVRTGTYYQIANGLQLDALKSVQGVTVLGGPQPPSILDGLSPKQDAKAIVDAAVKQILAALPKA
jgi:hypothetical protein